MVPVYEKPATPNKRRKKPGAREGHKGSRRKTPPKIDAHVEHRLEVCPCCGGELQRCKRTRKRIIEDIPQEITPVVTEHTVHRDYCPNCGKHVEPVVPDAMHHCSFDITFDQARSIEEVVNVMMDVRRLLTLMVDSPIYFLEVSIDTGDPDNLMPTRLYFGEPYKRMRDVFHQQMLLPLPTLVIISRIATKNLKAT